MKAILFLLAAASVAVASPYKLQTCEKTSILVSEEEAASGGKSLKFSDHPEARRPGYPYLFLTPAFMDNNKVRCACDLLLEDQAMAAIQFRATQSGKGVLGPTIQFAGGDIHCSGEPLGGYRVGEWVHLEIELDLKEGTWSASAEPESGSKVEHENVTFRDPAFKSCTWLGIISKGRAASAFYIDNLLLRPVTDGQGGEPEDHAAG